MRYAIIRDGIVENLTEWDGDAKTWQPPERTKAYAFPEGNISIGWEWNDGAPVDPNPVPAPTPPPEMTPKQKLEAAVGLPLADIKTILAGK